MVKAMTLKVSQEFTETPGERLRSNGKFSGQEFREDFLEPRFKKARLAAVDLIVDLDDSQGYASSFLEEAFGGLARKYGADKVLAAMRIKSVDEPRLAGDVLRYINDTRCI